MTPEREKELIAVAISGAPFPSARSRARAAAVLGALEAAGLRIVPVDAIEALEARVKMLETLLKDAADDLEGELDRFYGVTLNYPSQNRRYERDMQIVRDARAALNKDKQEDKSDGNTNS